MRRKLLLLFALCALPLLACNLSAGNNPGSANDGPPVFAGNNGLTPTSAVQIVTATPEATSTPTPTPFSSTASDNDTTTINTSNNTSDTGGSTGANGGSTIPAFSDISFSTTAGGTDRYLFPYGTQEVYLRWNYSNVPVGATVWREWYRDGILVASREEAWSSNWGRTGRLTHIKLYDYASGVAPGNYRVVIGLSGYPNTEIYGLFSVLATNSTFSSLTFSDSPNGAARTTFPYGTEEVYARWSYNGIPVESTVRRVWLRDGVQIINRLETWTHGYSGIRNDVRLYDFEPGGLTAGTYDVTIDMPNFPSARVSGRFVIEANLGPRLSNLRFATSGHGTPQTEFPAGTTAIFSIFDYSNIPLRAHIRRQWYYNGQLLVNRTEPWNFDRYGTSGTVRDISYFDTSGLPSGNWEVFIEIVGQPSDQARSSAAFTIGPGPVNEPSLSNIRFATSADGVAAQNFPAGTREVYLLFDYSNIPPNTQLRRTWYLNNEVYLDRIENWDIGQYGSNGTARHVSLFDYANGLPDGVYQVDISVIGYPETTINQMFVIGSSPDPGGDPGIILEPE